MHVIIPMSGVGKRFQEAGYVLPKPLIEVDGKPIISYVVSMFPGEHKFTFICNREHLETTSVAAVLRDLVPNAEIVSIEPHRKGPVYAVSKVFDRIVDDEEVIVNYCDFFSDWNYAEFLRDTRERKAAGAVAAYRGFHPHMLGTDNYAFIRDDNRWLQAIQEKKPFTGNRMQEYASNGTYYFQKGHYVKHYFAELIKADIQVNGEYYVSMVYNLLVNDGLPVSVYEVPHMLQWGTPKDLEEYQNWSNCFRDMASDKKPYLAAQRNSVTLIPAAGKGSRFQDAGYETPKPLIPINGLPMVVQATRSLPASERYLFVMLNDHVDQVSPELRKAFEHCSITVLPAVTEGQAVTCVSGLASSDPPVDLDSPLLIGACDNGMLWNEEKFQALRDDPSVDAIAFSFRRHPASKRRPEMYGWLAVDEHNEVKSVSVKKPISQKPELDHAIVGAFYFAKVRYFLEAYERLIEKNIRVNGEFYVDSIIGELAHLGYSCRVFEVDHYICWGTPDDYKTFQYWQGFFHQCPWHPYRVEKDRTLV